MTDRNTERFLYRIVYSRTGPARFTPHQDSITGWERTFRRARLPLSYSQGYSPKPQLRFPPPVPVGHCATNEMLDCEFSEGVELGQISKSMNEVVPEGLIVSEARVAGPSYGKLTSQITSIDYLATVASMDRSTSTRLNSFLQKEHQVTEVTRGLKTKIIDLRRAFISIKILNDQQIGMTIVAGSGGSARPEDILSLLDLTPVRMTRTGVHGPWDDCHR